MAGTFVTGGGNTTVSFSYTKPTAQAVAVITSAAHYLYRVADFGSLTNQQKLDIVDTWVRKQIIAMAKTYDIQAAKDASEAAAIITADANIDL